MYQQDSGCMKKLTASIELEFKKYKQISFSTPKLPPRPKMKIVVLPSGNISKYLGRLVGKYLFFYLIF